MQAFWRVTNKYYWEQAHAESSLETLVPADFPSLTHHGKKMPQENLHSISFQILLR